MQEQGLESFHMPPKDIPVKKKAAVAAEAPRKRDVSPPPEHQSSAKPSSKVDVPEDTDSEKGKVKDGKNQTESAKPKPKATAPPSKVQGIPSCARTGLCKKVTPAFQMYLY